MFYIKHFLILLLIFNFIIFNILQARSAKDLKINHIEYPNKNFQNYFDYGTDYKLMTRIPIGRQNHAGLDIGINIPKVLKETIIYKALESIHYVNFGLNIRTFFTEPEKIFAPYIEFGSAFQSLNWTYQNPIAADYGDEKIKINNDLVQGFSFNTQIGCNILKIKNFYLNLSQNLNYTAYLNQTDENFENDLFRNEVSTATGIEINLAF